MTKYVCVKCSLEITKPDMMMDLLDGCPSCGENTWEKQE